MQSTFESIFGNIKQKRAVTKKQKKNTQFQSYLFFTHSFPLLTIFLLQSKSSAITLN